MTEANQDNSSEPVVIDLQRALRQRLESLQRSGVMQMRRADPAEFVEPPAAQATPTVADHPQPPVSDESTHAKVHSPAQPIQPVPPPTTKPKPAAVDASGRPAAMAALAEEVAACTLCEALCTTRKQTVFGVGDPNARLVFFGEAPGADEDRLGEPFVGAAGQLLTKIIGAMTLRREDVYILNTLKCRPPGNRDPLPNEVENCRPFFDRQLAIIQPEYIVCLGAVSAQNLLGTTTSIGRLRGKFHDWQGTKVVATYHPAYLLRNAAAKKKVWEDMKMLMADMGLQAP